MNTDEFTSQYQHRRYKPVGPWVFVFHIVVGSFLLLGAAIEAIGVREGSFSLSRLMMAVSGVGLLVTARGASLWKSVLRYLAYALFAGVIAVWALFMWMEHCSFTGRC